MPTIDLSPTMPVKESFIAATALADRMTVVTRNVTDFEQAGCPVIDPFED